MATNILCRVQLREIVNFYGIFRDGKYGNTACAYFDLTRPSLMMSQEALREKRSGIRI